MSADTNRSPGDTTERLRGSRSFTTALRVVFPRIYKDLRRFAERQLSGQSWASGLSATDVTHDVYIGVRHSRTPLRSRRQSIAVFFAAVQHQVSNLRRKVRAKKRGGPFASALTQPLEQIAETDLFRPWDNQMDLQRLDLLRAIEELALQNQRAARLIKLHYLGELTIEQAASLVGISSAAAKNLLAVGRLWLRNRLTARP